MVQPKNRGDRLHNRRVKISAMRRYMSGPSWVGVTYRQLCIKAGHPKCPCRLCKRERYNRARAKREVL
jgi:hypothetical protein